MSSLTMRGLVLFRAMHTPHATIGLGEPKELMSNSTYSWVARKAKNFQTICEKECNGVVTPIDETKARNIQLALTNWCKETFKEHVHVEFHGDPRGHTVRLIYGPGSFDYVGLDVLL